jgi:outer membrane lipoprotein SlyB
MPRGAKKGMARGGVPACKKGKRVPKKQLGGALGSLLGMLAGGPAGSLIGSQLGSLAGDVFGFKKGGRMPRKGMF